MKVKGAIALASLTSVACLISGTSVMISAQASTTESRVTRLGYESIFDGWHEVPLETVTIHGTGTMPEIDPDSRRLYETVAQDLGQPVEEFIAATWSGNAVNELVDELTLAYPKLFVGASRANPAVTTSRYDLVFTKFPPPGVVDQVSELPVDVDIRTGAPLSYEQLMKVREVLSRRYSSDSRLVVDFSPLATSIRVRYLPWSGDGAGAAQGDQLRSAAGDLVSSLMRQGASRPAIKVELDDSLGREVNFADYMAGFGYSNTNCTTGFAATLNGVRGLLTARHCSDYLIYAPTGDNLGPSYNAVSGVDIQP